MQSSPQSSALFNNASMGIVVVNSKGTIQSINPFAVRLFGYSKEESLGQPIEMLIPNRFRHKHVNHRDTFIRHPRSRPMGVGMDLFALKKDGTEFPVEVSLGSYNNDEEENVIAFISDITIRKKAETEIKELNDELEAKVEQRTHDLTETLQQLEISNTKLETVLAYQKALLDNAGAMIVATDANGIIRLFNPEASNNLGYHESEVINKVTTELFHDKAEIEKKRIEVFQRFGKTIKDNFQVFVEKSRQNIHEEENYTYIRKDGSSFPASVTTTAIKDSGGQITGYMGVAIDISARKKAEEELHKALEKEKELNELKSRFVSMASHEFRTPLSTILSSSYLIEKYTTSEDQPKRDKHLNRIISSVNMLTDILNDFLSLGKIEEGKIQVRLVDINIPDYVRVIIDEMKNNLKKEQRLYYEHQGQPIVALDASLLKHIIMNLVTNAIKFSPEMSNIAIKTNNRDGQMILSVRDNGMGISTEDQKHLMERFFRGTNAGHIQGTGLGLHIISKYAELMNGTVECISELEKGTEFILTFITTKELT